MKSILLAGAMTLIVGVNAPSHAQDIDDYALPQFVCFRISPNENTEDVCYSDQDDDLTLAEEMAIARIIKRAQKRTEVREKAERAEYDRQYAIEADRLKLCTGMLWWKKCPPRTQESERYWTKPKQGPDKEVNDWQPAQPTKEIDDWQPAFGSR